MKSSSIILLASLLILLNAGFSMLQYRRYVQLELEEDSFSLPLDVMIEAMVGFVLGIFGTVAGYFAKLKDISVPAQFENKTTENVHARRALRNVQKTRSFVFNSFIAQSNKNTGYLSVKDAIKINPAIEVLIKA